MFIERGGQHWGKEGRRPLVVAHPCDHALVGQQLGEPDALQAWTDSADDDLMSTPMSPHRSGWTFRIGDVLSSDDPFAPFVTVVGVVLNDLLFVHRLMDDQGRTADERQYLLRTASSHLWEFSDALSDWQQHSPVGPLFDRLNGSLRDDLEIVSAIVRAGDPISKTIACLRNNAAWHYSKVPR